MKEGGISLEQARFLDPSTLHKWPDEYKLITGDVLVNSTGTGTVGRTRLFDSNCLGSYPFVVPDSHVTVVRTHPKVNSSYVHFYLSSVKGQEYIEDNLAGSTNQKELYVSVLENMLFPLPPLSEQNRITKTAEEWIKVIESIELQKQDLSSKIIGLKSRILDLAISGRLVQQDSTDESAIELLNRINPDFKPTDISHYENLPKGWTRLGLYQIITLLSGRDLETRFCNDSKEGIPYLIGASNIDRDKFNITRWTNQPEVISVKGDILISCKGTVGKVIENNIGTIHIARQFMAIRNKGIINNDYLILYLNTIISQLQRSARGVIPGISRDDILYKEINIPPLKEQDRIVRELNNLFKCIDGITAEL